MNRGSVGTDAKLEGVYSQGNHYNDLRLGKGAWVCAVGRYFETATDFLDTSKKRKHRTRSRSVSPRASPPGPPIEVKMPN